MYNSSNLYTNNTYHQNGYNSATMVSFLIVLLYACLFHYVDVDSPNAVWCLFSLDTGRPRTDTLRS